MSTTVASAFRQIPVREARRGLGKSIAVLRLEPAELSERLPIIFESGKDELDELLGAAIESFSGRQFGLLRYRHAPGAGTELVINERSVDCEDELREALSLLHLEAGDLTWVHPDIHLARD